MFLLDLHGNMEEREEQLLKTLLDKQNKAYYTAREERAKIEYQLQMSMRIIRRQLYKFYGVRIGDKVRFKENRICTIIDMGICEPYYQNKPEFYLTFREVGRNGKIGTFYSAALKHIQVIKK